MFSRQVSLYTDIMSRYGLASRSLHQPFVLSMTGLVSVLETLIPRWNEMELASFYSLHGAWAYAHVPKLINVVSGGYRQFETLT